MFIALNIVYIRVVFLLGFYSLLIIYQKKTISHYLFICYEKVIQGVFEERFMGEFLKFKNKIIYLDKNIELF